VPASAGSQRLCGYGRSCRDHVRSAAVCRPDAPAGHRRRAIVTTWQLLRQRCPHLAAVVLDSARCAHPRPAHPARTRLGRAKSDQDSSKTLEKGHLQQSVISARSAPRARLRLQPAGEGAPAPGLNHKTGPGRALVSRTSTPSAPRSGPTVPDVVMTAPVHDSLEACGLLPGVSCRRTARAVAAGRCRSDARWL
jgi:hypothetical protein